MYRLWEQTDMVRCTVRNIMVKCRTEELLVQQTFSWKLMRGSAIKAV